MLVFYEALSRSASEHISQVLSQTLFGAVRVTLVLKNVYMIAVIGYSGVVNKKTAVS